MNKKILAVALVALGAAAARSAVAADLWLHVRVHDETGEKVVLNLPMSLVKAATSMIPEESRGATEIRLSDHDMHVAELRRAWKELAKSPDSNYVSLNGPDGKVRVAKSGNYLVVHAADRHPGRNEQVDVKVPISVVTALLSGDEEHFNVVAALEAMAQEGGGELVTVTGDKGGSVRMWVDHAAESR